MRVTVKADVLARELGLLQRASNSKGAVPAYGCTRLSVAAGLLEATALDGRVDMRSSVTAEPSTIDEEGVAVVNLEKLRELSDTMGRDTVTLVAADGKLKLQGVGFNAQLTTMDADDFPRIATLEGDVNVTALSAGTLRRLLALTKFAMIPPKEEDSRYSLQGVQMEFETAETVRLVATDGHRLSTAIGPRPKGEARDPLLIPRQMVDILAAMLDGCADADGVTVALTPDGRMFFGVGMRTASSHGLEGKFPAWRKILPKAGTQAMAVKTEPLKLALRRMRVVSDKNRVELGLDKDGLTLKGSSADVGMADQTIAGKYKGDPVTLNVFGNQVAQFLDAVEGDEVKLEATSPDHPLVLRVAGQVATDYVVMPVRV